MLGRSTTFLMLFFFNAVVCFANVSPAVEPRVDRKIANFVLSDTEGHQVAMSDFNESSAIVVVFMGTECPIANSYLPDLIQLQERYKDQGVRVLGINSNPADSATEVAKHAVEFKLNFPVLIDEQQVAADIFRAERTPDVFVLDRRRNVRYAGRIDDRIGYSHKRDKSRRNDMLEAVKQILAGEEVTVPETKTLGCKITRSRKQATTSEITYSSHVASIIHKRCATCHHADTAAPFSLLTYEETRDWAEMIQEVVSDRRMPPWDIDSRVGHFKNDLTMPKDEIDAVVSWVEAGAPLGDPASVPNAPEFTPGWMIGKPDQVFAMPVAYEVPASGTVEYQYFVTPTNFEKDMWVQAAEPRPGTRSVVHHIIVFWREKGSTKTNRLPMVAGFAPGEEPTVYPDDVGMKIPAGAELVWQVHYTPTGRAETDRCELGIKFHKSPPERHIQGGGIFNTQFAIPAHAKNHEVVSEKPFSEDIELLSLMPHMHLRGKDFKYIALLPSGDEEVLLNIPDYDFNWQHSYKFEKPLRLPKGTTIKCIAHYDNSSDNPANPDPTELVKWGDQTWEEMMIGWYSYVTPKQSE